MYASLKKPHHIVTLRFSQVVKDHAKLDHFDTFGENFDSDTFKNDTFKNYTFESV